MLYHAKNGNIAGMDYICFGSGLKVFVMLPGLGDGLQTVKGTALPMALMYRQFAKEYRVYLFSRKNELPKGHTTRDMARDLAEAMEKLGIQKASVLGVSMGGMIAQWLAVDFPEKVEKLILAVTSAGPNPILTASVEEWMELAKHGNHTALMDSNVRTIYSDAYYRKNRWMIPVMGMVTKPKSYDRFLIQAEACLTHNAYEELSRIQSPTLIIGGEQDRCLGGDASREIENRIPGGKLIMFSQWGHSLYEEEKNFNRIILDYLKQH